MYRYETIKKDRYTALILSVEATRTKFLEIELNQRCLLKVMYVIPCKLGPKLITITTAQCLYVGFLQIVRWRDRP